MSSKSFAKSINSASKSNSIDEKFALSLEDELRSKKQAKKDAKKRTRGEIVIAKTILKAKRRVMLNQEIDRNEHDLIKR